MRKNQLSTLLALALMVISGGIVRAELTPNEIVARFSSSGTYGWSFTSSLLGTGERAFTGPAGFNVSGAYINGTSTDINSFNSFCIEPNVGSIASIGTAKLNFSGGNSTRRDSDQSAVSVGAAFLYRQYATGTFASSLYDYASTSQRTTDSSLLRDTLRALMNPQSGTLDWTGNKLLAYLQTVNGDRTYWTGVYNPNQRYDEIGDYAIFAMNIKSTTGTGQYQDFLYIAKADYGNGGGNGVPEPATFLLWSLGSFGALGVSRYRRVSTKK